MLADGHYADKINGRAASIKFDTVATNQYGTKRFDLVTSSLASNEDDPGDGFVETYFWDNDGRYDSQFFIPDGPGALKHRYKNNSSSWGAWRNVLDDVNYSSYAVPKTGGTFTGNIAADRSSTSGQASVLAKSKAGSISMWSGSVNNESGSGNLGLWLTNSAGNGSEIITVNQNGQITAMAEITGTAKFQKAGNSSSWANARDNCIFKQTSVNGYSPCVNLKTTNGDWSISTYNHDSWTDSLIFSYVTDTNYTNYKSTGNTAFNTATAAYLEGGDNGRIPVIEAENISSTLSTWSWRKWSDGVAECWLTYHNGSEDVSESWGYVCDCGHTTHVYTYPFPFKDISPSCSITPTGATGGSVWIATYGGSATRTPGFYFVRPDSGTVDAYAFIYAIGRWK